MVQTCANDTSEFHNIKQDGDQLNSRINKLEQIYNYYHEEKPLTKNIFISRIERRYYLKSSRNDKTGLRSTQPYVTLPK